MSFESGWHVAVRGQDLNGYSDEEVCLIVDLIANLAHPLRDVNAARTLRIACGVAARPSFRLHTWDDDIQVQLRRAFRGNDVDRDV